MNSRNKYDWVDLKTCRVCGMDSGIRKVTNSVPEEFFVVCEVCGYKTKLCKSSGAATKMWNRQLKDGE